MRAPGAGAFPRPGRARAGRRRWGCYSPQSSLASGASASATGDVPVTSSSALQSGHATISPFTASEPTVTSASHSGHLGTRGSIGLLGLVGPGRAVAHAAVARLVEIHPFVRDGEQGIRGTRVLREP